MDDDMANLIVAQLLYLDAQAPDKDITLYINSPGGSVTAGRFIPPSATCIPQSRASKLHRGPSPGFLFVVKRGTSFPVHQGWFPGITRAVC